MPKSQEPPAPQANNIVTVRVQRLAPGGLIVDLGQGREGLIREREIAWDAETRRGWRDRFHPGQTVRVIALKEVAGVRPEFSMRLASRDPWLDAETRYLPGALVDGVVTGIMSYGVFVELEAGLTGLVHAGRLPAGEKRQPAEIFWPGDYVRVIIDKVDAANRRTELSMLDLARQRWLALDHAGSAHAPFRMALPANIAAFELLPLENLIRYGAKLILVVDDDLQTREELCGWLRNAGHAVLAAHDSVSALAAAEVSAPEVALVDVDLREQSGIAVMRRLRTAWPTMQGILMTGQLHTHEDNTELQALLESGVSLLWKPFKLDELLTCIAGHDADERVAGAHKVRETARKPAQRSKQTAADMSERTLLARLRNVIHATSLALFSLDPASRQVRLVEQAGNLPVRADMLPELLHSPVRDVAEDGATVRALDIHEASSPRFRHLFALVQFDSCLGLPVPVEMHERFALFAFFHQPDLGGAVEHVEARMAAVAAMLGTRLERRQFVTQAAGMQRVLLLGQLSRSLIHEVNNQRQNLPGTVKLLKTRLQAIANSCDKFDDKDLNQVTQEIERAQTLVEQLGKELDRLTGVTDPLLLMARQDQRIFLLLDEMIHAAVSAMTDVAVRANVRLATEQLTPFCYTRSPASSVVQVLINLLLNAIQQIGQARGQGGGRVLIGLVPAQAEGRTVYHIRVEDDGPGIHRRLWERIFEMGYTDREEGSGLGLFISRNLVEAMGGRLYVAHSAIGWGSTFVIELPQQS